MKFDVSIPGQFFVYVVTCLVTNKNYVGIVHGRTQTVLQHWKDYCKGRGTPKKLVEPLKQFGPRAFAVTVVAKANSKEELSYLEKDWIKKLDTFEFGYNANYGGVGQNVVFFGPRLPGFDTVELKIYMSTLSPKLRRELEKKWAEPQYRSKFRKMHRYYCPGSALPHSSGYCRFCGRLHN